MTIAIRVLIITLSALSSPNEAAQEAMTPSMNPPKSQAIISAGIAEFRQIPQFGDLWPCTWAEDGNLYLAFGDATGLGPCMPVVPSPDPATAPIPVTQCLDAGLIYELVVKAFRRAFPKASSEVSDEGCFLTQAGLLRVEGPVAAFKGCGKECLMSINIPTGIPQFEQGIDPYTRRTDKASSLLYCDGVLYWAGHDPSGIPRQGYIAYSTDFGRTWSEVPSTPWTGESNFRVLMFINMGKNYELNKDGFVYGLGIGEELGRGRPPKVQPVYLTRVPKDSIKDYSKYTYYAGGGMSDAPRWCDEQADAKPLLNLQAVATGAAMYHPGVKRNLFLVLSDFGSGRAITLYEGANPWGPWAVVQVFEGQRYIPGIIAKDTGPASFYFTAAGGSATYQLNIGRIEMELNANKIAQ